MPAQAATLQINPIRPVLFEHAHRGAQPSNPRGSNEDGLSDDHYACFFNIDTWRDYFTSAGFLEVGHYYCPPGLPRHRQPWLATVWRKA
jgi:hypothetical protein